MENNCPCRILLVEDNPAEARLVKEVFDGIDEDFDIYTVFDGEQAINDLEKAKENKYDILILDLNLPKKNGIDVLKEIKEKNLKSGMPIIVLTNSESENDVAKSYDLDADCFVTKPAGLDQFVETINSIEKFWLKRRSQ